MGEIIPNNLSVAEMNVLLHGVIRILGSFQLTTPPLQE